MHNPFPAELPRPVIVDAIGMALREDLGRAGDVTSLATLSPRAEAEAMLAIRDGGVIAGLDLAVEAFEQMQAGIDGEIFVEDGEAVGPGTEIMHVTGPARALLSAERTALNFLNHLSGIATQAAAFAERIEGTTARITCTRKTTPGLRALEKYAVRCGGGSNHRFGLDDAILIKDNHIAVCGGVAEALTRARAYGGHLLPIEIEVDTLDQLVEALDADARIILLDNMEPGILREAVALTAGRAVLEASGGIDLDTVRGVAETGVDYISTSRITMGAGTVDIGLDIDIRE